MWNSILGLRKRLLGECHDDIGRMAKSFMGINVHISSISRRTWQQPTSSKFFVIDGQKVVSIIIVVRFGHMI